MFEKKLFRSDMLKCVLCRDAPCSSACGKHDPAGLLRSIWFDNEKAAASRTPTVDPCLDCSAPCEAACVRPHEVPIRELMMRLHDEVKPELELPLPEEESRLRTDLCGVPLDNPFLLSSSVVASTYDMCERAFEAGWAGVAFKTKAGFYHSDCFFLDFIRKDSLFPHKIRKGVKVITPFFFIGFVKYIRADIVINSFYRFL